MRRVYATGEAAVREALNQQLTKFEYPDEIGGGGGISIGGGGGAPTVVVAASDASELSKSKADFVCSGVDDQNVIQQAVDVLVDGGRVLLTEGNFSCSWGSSGILIHANQGESVTIEGMGNSATILNASGTPGVGDTFVLLRGTGDCIRNLRVESDYTGALTHYAVELGNSYQSIENVTGYTGGSGGTFLQATGDLHSVRFVHIEAGGAGIVVSGSYSWIDNCSIFVTNEPIEDTGQSYMAITNNHLDSSAGQGILLAGISYARIHGNYIDAFTHGIDGSTAATSTLIQNNQILFGSGSVGIQGSGIAWQIEGNYLTGSGWGIVNEGDQEWMIRGNRLSATDGIRVDATGHNTTIEGNFLDAGGQILFDGGSFNECKVSNNIWTTASSAAVDGAIVFDNGASLCQITNNSIPDANGEDGIRVESASDVMISGNLIGGCDKGIVVNGDGVSIVGNQMNFPGEHGIHASDLSDSLISDNLIWKPGQNTTNTWDGIILDGDSDRNHIMNNRIIGSSSAPKPRYALNVSASTCDDNSYLGNRSGPSGDYGTGTYNDAGTGTINTWPAAAAPQGDNLQ